MACQRGRSALWVMVVGGLGTSKTTETSALQPLFGAPFVIDNGVASTVLAKETGRSGDNSWQ
jgi:hypothetical protein